VYRRDDVNEASYTAFVTVIVSSLLLYLIAVIVAPLVATFFRDPLVTPILRVLALTVPISAIGRVPYALLSRDLDFRRKVFPEVAANVVGSGASIGFALAGAGAWSLVWGQLIRVALAAGLIWTVTTWRPKLRFSRPIFRELFRYGKHITSSQTLIFFITNVDNAIVGRYAGQTALGYYQFAYSTSNIPATQITSVVNQVMFPAFSRMGEDSRGLRSRYYLTAVRYITWITLPMAVATILFADEFVLGLYGQVWAPAILPLKLLAVYGLIRSIAANMGNVFRAMGKPQWLTYIAVWRLATMLVFLYPVVKLWGIVGVSAFSTGVAVVDFWISGTLTGRLVDAPWRAYARILLPTGAAALAAGIVVQWLYPTLQLPRTWQNLVTAGILIVVLYAVLVWLTDPQFRQAVRSAFLAMHRLLRQQRGDGSTVAVEPPPAQQHG
jgi:O-antigen/teichoic acid export membrane protein